jgi:hypothetical protein
MSFERGGDAGVGPEDAVELGDLDGTENFGVGGGYADGDARGFPLFVAFEDGVESCASEMRDTRKVDDEQPGRVIQSPLQGGDEMEDESRETLRIDLTDRRHHDSDVADILVHFQ